MCYADGFPRTALQVDFLKLLYDKMLELHNKHADGPEEWQYPRPSFKVPTPQPPDFDHIIQLFAAPAWLWATQHL